MSKITITRALVELKLLNDRINKEIEQTNFIDVYQNRANKAIKSNVTKEEFSSRAISNYQSIIDLIERRKKIKGEILKSNSITTIKIDNEKYLVVEAIERKNSIVYEQILLKKMKHQFSNILENVNTSKANIERQIEQMVTANLGTDKKTNKEDWDNIAKPFFEANELNLLDPLKLERKIQELDKKIDSFIAEVDFVLSESNAKTEIEI